MNMNTFLSVVAVPGIGLALSIFQLAPKGSKLNSAGHIAAAFGFDIVKFGKACQALMSGKTFAQVVADDAAPQLGAGK